MFSNAMKSLMVALSAGLALASCGGGGGGGAASSSSNSSAANSVSTSSNPAGVSNYAPVVTSYSGIITGLGSVVVNGVRFEKTDALVFDGDDFRSAYDQSTSSTYSGTLALGTAVALQGEVDDAQSVGRAHRIRVVGGVRGNMVAIDTAALTLSLTAQSVKLSAATTYGGSFNGLAISTLSQLAGLLSSHPLLTVYGQTQADSSFLATRVEVSLASNHAYDVTVRGTLLSVSSATYVIATGAASRLAINCSSSCTTEPSGATAQVGDLIRALATDATQLNGNTLTAAKIQLLNASYLHQFQGAPNTPTYAKIKGVALLSAGVWTVAGVKVSGVDSALAAGVAQSASTVFEVRGNWTGSAPNQVLAATRVEVETQHVSASSNGSSQTYTHELYGAVGGLSGSTFMVQGVTVNTANAYFENGSLATLSNGTYVEVKGSYNSASGNFVATKVEVKGTSTTTCNTCNIASFEMNGVVSNWTGVGNTFTLTRGASSITAKTSSATLFKTRLPLNGDYVEVKGFMDANNVFQVTKLGIENGRDD